MKASLFPKLIAALAALVVASGASAQIVSASFNFDSVPSGSLATLFNTPNFSFHEAEYVPFTDVFGDPIAGTEHWQIDVLNDGLFPVMVENPLNYGRGAAPSGSNALQALFQPVLIQFNQSYNLLSFSATLDNDRFGGLEKIAFITEVGTLSEWAINQAIPGLSVNVGAISNIRGIVLPGGAFYDNITLSVATPIPEPSTWGISAALVCLAGALLRRRQKRT